MRDTTAGQEQPARRAAPKPEPTDIGRLIFRLDEARALVAARWGQKRPLTFAAMSRGTGLHLGAITDVFNSHKLHPEKLGPICAYLGCEPSDLVVWVATGSEPAPLTADRFRYNAPPSREQIAGALVPFDTITTLLTQEANIRAKVEGTGHVRKGAITFLLNGMASNLDLQLLAALCTVTGQPISAFLRLVMPAVTQE